MRNLAMMQVLTAKELWMPDSVPSKLAPRSSGPKNGKTAKRKKQKAARKAKQQTRRMK